MARVNKIFIGPVDQNKPQVQERICTAAILPGTALIESGANFAQAGANALGKVYVAQDNYLAQKGVDDTWPANDRIVGIELIDNYLLGVRVPTGVNVTRGAGLTTNGSGKFVLATTGQRILVFADEAYNNTSGADQIVRARPAQNTLGAA